jgi:hypothetical protein
VGAGRTAGLVLAAECSLAAFATGVARVAGEICARLAVAPSPQDESVFASDRWPLESVRPAPGWRWRGQLWM